MPRLMRCRYCGTLQDEPAGAKLCVQCGGELVWETPGPAPGGKGSYVRAHLVLDQIAAPAGQPVERHVIVTVETPGEVPPAQQAKTHSGRDPLHFCAVLDISGSMSGGKIDAAKRAVDDAVHRLQDGDVFSLVTFATDVRCPLSAKRVDAGLRRIIRSSLGEIRAGGQTALCGGLELGLQQVLDARQGTNLALLLSDGQANVGETDVEAIGRRAMEARGKGITVSSLGVGRDYNEALMAEIAIDGGGRFYHLADAGQIAAYLTGELGEMASLAARGAVVSLDLPGGATLGGLSDVYPVRGNQVTLGDIPTGTTLEVVLRVLIPPQEAGARLPISGTLSYRSPAGNALSTVLNEVTVRCDLDAGFAVTDGVVKPIARRVLDHMQAACVLATSRAATRGAAHGAREVQAAEASLRKYVAVLGDDPAREGILAAGVEALGFVSGRVRAPGDKAKAATYAALRRIRGSKDFDKT